MRSRRRKGRRNRDGLWICGIAVLAAGAVFTARTEILDLVTTEIAFVLDPKQEGGERKNLTRILRSVWKARTAVRKR